MKKLSFTKSQVREALVRGGGFVVQAARILGCDVRTVYNYLDRWPDLKIVRKDTERGWVELAENKLIEKINSGDTASLIFFLKTKGGYSSKTESKIELDVVSRDKLATQVDELLGLAGPLEGPGSE
jgi:hypothetical protein